MRLPQAGVRAHGIDASADDHRGIEASGGKNGGNHRSGGGFAVHAGDGNAVLQAHQLGQHFSALDDRDVQVARRNDFGVVFGDGGAGDDDFCTGDVFGAMPFKRCGAQTGQAFGDSGGLEIGAGNLVSEIEQDLRDAAHADAADAYEVDALNFGEHGTSGSEDSGLQSFKVK